AARTRPLDQRRRAARREERDRERGSLLEESAREVRSVAITQLEIEDRTGEGGEVDLAGRGQRRSLADAKSVGFEAAGEDAAGDRRVVDEEDCPHEAFPPARRTIADASIACRRISLAARPPHLC